MNSNTNLNVSANVTNSEEDIILARNHAVAVCRSLIEAHPNSHSIWNTFDERRADLLTEYLDAIRNICPDPQLIPLGEASKAPAIKGKCSLGSRQEKGMRHTREEATTAIRQGANGFALYAGNPDHGTEDLVFADHDEMHEFPLNTLPDTLTVVSGSGEGYHETFVNAGDVQNAKSEGGEIRASNWYVVVPGSIHPSGGVYYVEHERSIVNLGAGDIPERLRPASNSHNEYENPDPLQESHDGGFTNEQGMSLLEVREYDDELNKLLNTRPQPDGGKEDDSKVDAHLVWRLRFHHFEPSDITAIWQRYRSRPKLKRDDYVQRTIQFAGTHNERCRYDGSEQSISLPEVSSDCDSDEWDWREPSADDERALTLGEARSRCQQRINSALRNGEYALIDALPAMGKSSGVIRGAAHTDTRITVFTARHELYEQYSKWCEEHGLSYYTLPSFHEDCPTAGGEYDDEWQDRVLSLYKNDIMPSEIHKYAKQYFGEPLPCDDGQECPYKQKWDVEFEEYDVLVGHYTHSYQQNTTAGRVAVFDEFPADSLLTKFDSDTVSSAVSSYCSEHDALPFEDYTSLLEGRNSQQGDEACDWFDGGELERDGKPVFSDETDLAHAYAPLITYALLKCEDLDNGWEGADLDPEAGLNNHRKAARSRASGEVHLLLPPNLDQANGVIALDGTPTTDLWQLTVDTRLNHEQVLSDEERADYLSDALDFSIIQTADDAAYSYSGGNAVKPQRDKLLFEAVADHKETEPALISTAKAMSQYKEEGVLTPVGTHEHYGNLKGSNQFEDEYVGVVAGSRHYGDDHPKMWGALAGTNVERLGDGRGMDLDYGEFGNKVLRHMREREVLQAVLRFGRNDRPTTVYVHTAALPEWVPVEAEGEIQRWSKGTREVVEVLDGNTSDEWKTADISERLPISSRQVRNVLNELSEKGYVEKGKDGRATLWEMTDSEIDRLSQVRFRSSQ